jgi:hypothetical protein
MLTFSLPKFLLLLVCRKKIEKRNTMEEKIESGNRKENGRKRKSEGRRGG